MTVRFEDGREAVVSLALADTFDLPLNFEVSENSCTPVVGVRCRFYMGLQVGKMALVWSHHPDPSRLNTVVKIRTTPTGSFYPRESTVTYLGADRKLMPKAAHHLPKDRMVCEDWGWLPGGSVATPPASIQVLRWENEQMLTNPETGLSENRLTGGAHGVLMRSDFARELVVEDVQYYVGVSAIPALFLGDIAGLTWLLPSGDFCETSLKAALAEFMNAAQAYFGAARLDGFKPYIYGSDELTEQMSFDVFTDFKTPGVEAE